jgi:ArsR family transcriptional regulator
VEAARGGDIQSGKRRVSQRTVSHHVRKLREARVITSERRGTWVYYQVEPDVLAAMETTLAPTM